MPRCSSYHYARQHFWFGDSTWVQQNGTAMGTPPAPAYAQLYYLIHELSFMQRFLQLQLYVRYLDNIFVIWKPTSDRDPQDWDSFQEIVNSFGNLQWNFEECSKKVTFLDLEIHLDHNGLLFADIYEKELNLYLYLPPHSSHSQGVLR